MSRDRDAEKLGESFQQSRREFRFMVLAWVVFAAWTGIYVKLSHRGSESEPLQLVWGMPDWVVFGILLPWFVGLSLTIWFALYYMKDTELGPSPSNHEARETSE